MFLLLLPSGIGTFGRNRKTAWLIFFFFFCKLTYRKTGGPSTLTLWCPRTTTWAREKLWGKTIGELLKSEVNARNHTDRGSLICSIHGNWAIQLKEQIICNQNTLVDHTTLLFSFEFNHPQNGDKYQVFMKALYKL